jgi:hypothetical protein
LEYCDCSLKGFSPATVSLSCSLAQELRLLLGLCVGVGGVTMGFIFLFVCLFMYLFIFELPTSSTLKLEYLKEKKNP